jgi:hypothetical protein
MSLIKPRTRGKQFVQYRTRLEQQNHEALHAYAAFIGEDPEYVLNELLDSVLAKDKDFVKWRADHPQSFAPRTLAARSPEPRKSVGSRAPAPALSASTATPSDTRM